jgi:hypothetical protein
VGAKIQAKEKAKKNRFEKCKTHVRPYISERGPTTKGPTANASRYMLRVSAIKVGFVMLYRVAISGRPGAIILDANGLCIVKVSTKRGSMKGDTHTR